MPHSDKIMLSYFLTTNCNLECIYCYNAKERAEKGLLTLPLEFAKLGTDYFFENFESRHIRFYGPGEPTIAFVRMQEIYDYANSLCGNALSVELQTNGVFSDKVCSWIAQHVNIVWVSFDGPPDIHNKNRPGINGKPSSEIIEKNVRNIIAQTTIDSMVGARVTITNANVERQEEMVDYFHDLGIKYIWTDPEFHSVEDKPVIARSAPKPLPLDINQYVDLLVDTAQYAQSKGVFYGSFLGCSFDGETDYHCRACIPVPHLTPDGYVSACDMVVEGGDEKSHMNIFVYGKWNKEKNTIEWDEKKIKTLRSRNIKNMPHCQGCEVKNNCAGYCLGEVLNEVGCLFGQKTYACGGIKRLYKKVNKNFGKFKFLHP